MIGFVLGTGCCGSSLVHEILARHPDVGFLSNVDDRMHRVTGRGVANRRVYSRIPQEWTRKGRVRFAPSEGYRVLEAAVSPLVAFPGRRLWPEDVTPRMVEAFREFFVTRWDAQGTPHWLHKFTGASRVPLMRQAFPEARYIHIVRDGRAVANSFIKQSWWVRPDGVGQLWRSALPAKRQEVLRAHGDSWLLLSAMAWYQMLDDHDEDRATVPDGAWLDIRYEDVVRDPTRAVGQMCDHLGVPFGAELRSAVCAYQLEPSRAEGFRREMPDRALALLTEQLAEPLTRFGYRV